MKYCKNLILILLLFTLSACGSKLLTVYKIDVQQGNALDAETVEKVQIGMTKEQVQYVLGSPIISDSFHPDRWDYIYLFIPGYGEQERKQLTIFFDRDEVIDIAKNNINKGETAGIKRNPENKDKSKSLNEIDDDNLTERETKEQEELEKLERQAEDLNEALETNKDPNK